VSDVEKYCRMRCGVTALHQATLDVLGAAGQID
jgi:hypothetical protein